MENHNGGTDKNKASSRKNGTAPNQGSRDYKKQQEDFTAQKLFEGQDKRVRGGYDEAILSLQNQSSNFKTGLTDLRSRIKGLSAYTQMKKPQSDAHNYGGGYGKGQQAAQMQQQDYREFDYHEFARQNNILIQGAQNILQSNQQQMNINGYNAFDKPRAQKEFESEFFKMFNRK